LTTLVQFIKLYEYLRGTKNANYLKTTELLGLRAYLIGSLLPMRQVFLAAALLARRVDAFYATRPASGMIGTTHVVKYSRRTFAASAKKGNSKPPSLRLERVLSNRGHGSRSEVAVLVRQGRVRVENKVMKSPSEKIPANASITVDGVEVGAVPLLMAYHKPLNVLSSMGDPMGRPSLKEVVPVTWERMGLHPVGRLDADTTGLLLFSSDGALTQRLLHPSGGVEREYRAVVEGDATRLGLREELSAGVETSDGTFPATLLDAKLHDGSLSNSEGGEPGSMVTSTVRLMVKEGKYRMVRRILANTGHPVIDLHRVRYGGVTLDELDIPEGQFSEITDEATAWAKDLMQR
jgi:23S rRNA pseudouridine2605 synthase